MKLSPLLLSAIVFVLASCSNDTGKFEGVWQSINDPSKQIIFTNIGSSITFETRNMTSPAQGLPGKLNEDGNALVFDQGNGSKSSLVYIDSTQHIIGFGDEFERATSIAQDKSEASEASEDPADSAPAETTDASTTKSSCDQGDILVISGNNVRVRNEPDVTKQNILFQVHKNYEVVRLDDKTVDGQKWYKVCYDGNIGWVSGQYAAKK
jgi:Bacterial SH3 domain